MRRPPSSLILPVALALALSACLNAAPPPAATPPEVTAGTSSVSLSMIPVATIAPWLGTWTGGGRTVVVARSGDMLTANGHPLTFVGLGTFADAAGTSYLFGPGESLRTFTAAGTETRFTR